MEAAASSQDGDFVSGVSQMPRIDGADHANADDQHPLR
jgi:hypothetical protein